MVNYELVFEWDIGKEEFNICKHGVSFGEAVETFSDPNGFALVDEKHSRVEPRYFWIGKTFADRVLTTRFTLRRSIIRIIGSAEWREFRSLYNEKTKIK